MHNDDIDYIVLFVFTNKTENPDPLLLCTTRAWCMNELTHRLHNIYKNNLATCIHIRVFVLVASSPGYC
jgi:hypothetical protein